MKICYFGIYNPEFSRNKIYIGGFRSLGVEIIECRDDSPGLLKFWRLWQKHQKIKNSYDAMIVGYPGHLVVPFAKLLSKKNVIADLLGSLYDAEVHSHKPSFFKEIKAKAIDWLAVKFADIVLLESEAQKKYFETKFGKSKKYKVVYTGSDFEAPISRLKGPPFTVLFRGRLSPESGIQYIVEAAKILKSENIIFIIIGAGQPLPQLPNVEHISTFLPKDELVRVMLKADLSLGQLEDNPRLNRTIPHKAFESFALGIPYLSGDAPAVTELVQEGQTGFLTPLANASALAARIKELSRKKEVLAEVSRNAKQMFSERFTPEILALQILQILQDKY